MWFLVLFISFYLLTSKTKFENLKCCIKKVYDYLIFFFIQTISAQQYHMYEHKEIFVFGCLN